MGLAGALGMRQARPCYWSQTSLLLTKNSKKSYDLTFTLAELTLHFNYKTLDFD